MFKERAPSSKSSKSNRDKNETPLDEDEVDTHHQIDQEDPNLQAENELELHTDVEPDTELHREESEHEPQEHDESHQQPHDETMNGEQDESEPQTADQTREDADLTIENVSLSEQTPDGPHGGDKDGPHAKKEEQSAEALQHKKELLAKRKARQPKFDGNLIPEEGDEGEVNITNKIKTRI